MNHITLPRWGRAVSGVGLLFGSLLVACGCGRDRPFELVPVEGRVLLDGLPVQGASVQFRAEGAPRIASGRTDADGRFSLSMFEPQDGAIVGPNRVAVIKREELNVDAEATAETVDVKRPDARTRNLMAANRRRQAAVQAKRTGSLLPEKYADFDTSGLSFVVLAGGGNDFQIRLESEDAIATTRNR